MSSIDPLPTPPSPPSADVPPSLPPIAPLPGVPQLGGEIVQAGFLRRWAALFLDSLILTCAFYAVFFVVIIVFGIAGGMEALAHFDSEEPPAWFVGAYLGLYLLYFVMAGLYYALLESSASQATVGKMALGIKVVDRDGRRLSFPHALGRWFAAALSYVTLYIGFLMAAFTERKQALHDILVGSFVVDKWAYTDRPELQQRGLSGCLIAFLVLIVLLGGLVVVSILAAIAIPAYQDYTQRAHAGTALVAVAPLKERVQQAWADTGECPTNTSEGFAAPADYAGNAIARIVVAPMDEYEDGGCGITVWLRPGGGAIEEENITFEYLPDNETWVCTSSLDSTRLPPECR